jgi:hypothetical protein
MRFSLFVRLQLLCTRKDPHNKAMTTGIVNVCVVIFTIEYIDVYWGHPGQSEEIFDFFHLISNIAGIAKMHIFHISSNNKQTRKKKSIKQTQNLQK